MAPVALALGCGHTAQSKVCTGGAQGGTPLRAAPLTVVNVAIGSSAVATLLSESGPLHSCTHIKGEAASIGVNAS